MPWLALQPTWSHLYALGVEICKGDITDAGDVRRAATGADAAIHCAALLGGASQNLPDFEAVNVQGTKHVLDVAEALGIAGSSRSAPAHSSKRPGDSSARTPP